MPRPSSENHQAALGPDEATTLRWPSSCKPLLLGTVRIEGNYQHAPWRVSTEEKMGCRGRAAGDRERPIGQAGSSRCLSDECEGGCGYYGRPEPKMGVVKVLAVEHGRRHRR